MQIALGGRPWARSIANATNGPRQQCPINGADIVLKWINELRKVKGRERGDGEDIGTGAD